MKSSSQNFTKITLEDFPNLKKNKIGIVVSEWNKDITSNLLNGAQEKLIEFGIKMRISKFHGYLEVLNLYMAVKNYLNKTWMLSSQ